jgi:hypothetical protein
VEDLPALHVDEEEDSSSDSDSDSDDDDDDSAPSDTDRIISFLRRKPSSSARNIAAGVNMERQAVESLLEQLASGGYVYGKSKPDRNHLYWYAADAGQGAFGTVATDATPKQVPAPAPVPTAAPSTAASRTTCAICNVECTSMENLD